MEYQDSTSLFTVSRILFVIALLGLVVSGYLLYTYVSGAPIVCGEGHGCDVIRSSIYSSFFGIPTPGHGVIFYSLLAYGAIMWKGDRTSTMARLLQILTGIGFAVTAWLTYLEAFVLEAWCRWCVVSAVLATFAFVIVWATILGYGTDKRA